MITQLWTKNYLDTSFNLTICEIIFGKNQTINAINLLSFKVKWFINNSRSFNKPIIFFQFSKLLQNQINELIVSKTSDPPILEIDMLIALEIICVPFRIPLCYTSTI